MGYVYDLQEDLIKENMMKYIEMMQDAEKTHRAEVEELQAHYEGIVSR
jgi:hypothetical protein